MKNISLILTLIVMLVAFVGSNLLATEYKIKSASELSNLSLNAGDVVVLQNGTWTNQELVLRGVGTAEAPITLRAETAGQVILTGSSTLNFSGEYLIIEGLTFFKGKISSSHIIEFRTGSSSLASNCRLTNTIIKDYNPSSDGTEYKWVSVYGKNNRVDHCQFTGKNHEGALLVVWLDRTSSPTPNYHQIDHNYFGTIPEFSGGNGAEAIRIGTSDYSMQESRTTVEYNVFEKCDGEIEIISNKSCFNTYRYNTFRNSAGCLTLRHGNDCEIYGNFFFGEGKSESGGIRIIGENHKVYNNYLQDLKDDGFRSAISVTNGVPDSPLNRYFQVKNAEIVNNTLVNCNHPIVIGAGANGELSLPPIDCKIANNVIARYAGSMDDMVEYKDDPINMTYQNNMFYGGDLGIDQPEGIEITDPELAQTEDFYRPASTSPVVGYGSKDYSYITHDIDGQSRSTDIDAGTDQISTETINNTPLTKNDVGVDWEEWLKGVSAAEGGTKLTEYINTANNGDVIILTTSGGQYNINAGAVLDAHIQIIAESGLSKRPIISAAGNVDEFVNLESESSLYMSGINFIGESLTNVFTAKNENVIDSIIISDCDFSDLSGSVVRATNSSVINRLAVSNSRNYDLGGGYDFLSGAYPLILSVENTTFVNTSLALINIENAANSAININHCTIDNAAFSSTDIAVFNFTEATLSLFNSIFSHCGLDKTPFTFSNSDSQVNYCVFSETGMPTTTDGILGINNWDNIDPEFASRENLDFTLLPTSFALTAGNDGENLGDLYWNIENGHPDNNALLEDIQIDGITLEEFIAETLIYDVSITDKEDYTIEATAQSTTAEVKIRYPDNIPGQAFIEVTAENNINKYFYTLKISVKSSVSVTNSAFSSKISPNPNQGEFNLDSNDRGVAFVYNQQGKIINQFNVILGRNTIQLYDIPDGLYILQLNAGEFSQNTKLIITNKE